MEVAAWPAAIEIVASRKTEEKAIFFNMFVVPFSCFVDGQLTICNSAHRQLLTDIRSRKQREFTALNCF